MTPHLTTRKKLRTWSARQPVRSQATADTMRYALRRKAKGYGNEKLDAVLKESAERLTATTTGNAGHG